MSDNDANIPGSYHRPPRPVFQPPLQGFEHDQPGLMPVYTLHPLWCMSLMLGPKDWENRKAPPPRTVRDRRVAFHSGLHVHTPEEWAKWRAIAERARQLGQTVPELRQGELIRGNIIGTALITGFIDITHGTSIADPWMEGPFCWSIADKRPCLPIPVGGKQGVWYVDAARVRAATEEYEALQQKAAV